MLENSILFSFSRPLSVVNPGSFVGEVIEIRLISPTGNCTSHTVCNQQDYAVLA